MEPLSDEQYATLAAFRGQLRRFLRFSERAAAEMGVPSQQYQALLAIKGFAGAAPISIGGLADELQVRHHSAVELANRLEAQGFVRREPGPDRRTMALALTERGETILAALARSHHDELRRIGPLLRALLDQVGGAAE